MIQRMSLCSTLESFVKIPGLQFGRFKLARLFLAETIDGRGLYPPFVLCVYDIIAITLHLYVHSEIYGRETSDPRISMPQSLTNVNEA